MGKYTFVCLCVFSTCCVVLCLLYFSCLCSAHAPATKDQCVLANPLWSMFVELTGLCLVLFGQPTLHCPVLFSLSNYISPFGIISQSCFHVLVWYVRACVFCLAGHLSHSVNPHDSYTPTPYHVLPVFLSSFLFSLPIANHLLMIMSLLKDEYILLWNQSHHIFACNWEQQNVLLISVADSLVAYRLKY